jgi:hypothetical protein
MLPARRVHLWSTKAPTSCIAGPPFGSGLAEDLPAWPAQPHEPSPTTRGRHTTTRVSYYADVTSLFRWSCAVPVVAVTRSLDCATRITGDEETHSATWWVDLPVHETAPPGARSSGPRGRRHPSAGPRLWQGRDGASLRPPTPAPPSATRTRSPTFRACWSPRSYGGPSARR